MYRVFCTCLLVIYVCFPISTVAGQFTLERILTSEDGLAMTETNRIGRDPQGQIWIIGTNGKLSRHDGTEIWEYPDSVSGVDFYNNGGGELFMKARDLSSSFYHLSVRGLRPIPLSGEDVRWVPNYFDQRAVLLRGDSLYYYDFNSTELTVEIQKLADFPQPPPAWTSSYSVSPTGSILNYHHEPLVGIQVVYAASNNQIEQIQPDHPNYGDTFWPSGARVYRRDTLGGYDANNQPIREFPFGLRGYTRSRANFYFRSRLLNLEKTFNDQGLSIMETFLWDEEEPSVSLLARYPVQTDFSSHPALSFSGHLFYGDHSGLHVFKPGVISFRSGQNGMVGALHSIVETPSGDILFGSYGSGISRWQRDIYSVERFNTQKLPATLKILPGSFSDRIHGHTYFANERSIDQPFSVLRYTNLEDVDKITITDRLGKILAPFHFAEVELPEDFSFNEEPNHADGKQRALSIGLSISSPTAERETLGQFALLRLDGSDDPSYRIIGQRKGVRITNVLTTCQDLNGRIWFAHHSSGMGFYDPQLDTAFTDEVLPNEPYGAIATIADQWGTVWLGTRKGVALIPRAHEITHNEIDQVSERIVYLAIDGVPSDKYVGSITIRNDSLFFGHFGGLGIIDLHQFYATGNYRDFPCYVFNTLDYDMGSSEQNTLLFDSEGYLWHGTDEGALRYDLADLLRWRSVPRIEGLQLMSDQGELAQIDSTSYRLPSKDRSLEFSYLVPIRDRFQADARAEILLVRVNGDTISREVAVPPGQLKRISYLQPGKYLLKVDLRYDNQVVESRSYEISVPKTFWENWWAWVGTGLLLGLLIGGYYYFQARRRKLQAQLERAKKEEEGLRVQALVGTINPHFITNVLEWVEMAVRAEETDKAVINSIIGNVGHNVRIMFNSAYERRAGHPFKEEWQTVINYLETINIQMENRYQFEYPDLDSEIIQRIGHHQVFLLQLQIHVENAFEHGLRSRSESKGIKISITDDQDFIYVQIEDDGGGISRAQRKEQVGSRKGRAMLLDLEKLFNHRNEWKHTTTFASDLYPDPLYPDEKYGTRVSLKIPKRYSYEL